MPIMGYTKTNEDSLLAALQSSAQPDLSVATAVTANATLVANKITPADATTGPLTLTLPAPTALNQQIVVEKFDNTANVVTVAGTIRGAATTIGLSLSHETVVLEAESLTSWRPTAGHKTLASLDTRYPRWVNFTDPRYADAGGDAGKTWNACVAALGTPGGTIFVPSGTYTGATVPVPASNIVCRGVNEHASLLVFTSGGFTWSTNIAKVRFEDIGLQSVGGDLFAPTGSGGMYQSVFNRCVLQNTDGHSIWNQNNGGEFQEITVQDCELYSGAGATVPGWNVVNSGGAANCNRFLRLRVNGANNALRPFFWIESSSAGNYAYDNTFTDITGEQNAGGLIYLLSNHNSEIRNAQDYDATTPYTGDVVRVGKSATGGLQSKWCLVTKSGRRGGTLGAGIYDVNIGPSNSAVYCVAMQNNYSTGAVTSSYSATTTVIGEGVVTGIAPNIQFFATTGTWVMPVGAKTVDTTIISGGGGGASGRRGAAGSVRCGGGGAGGAQVVRRQFAAADLTAAVTITVGAAGTGGAAVTTDDTNGNAGVAGGLSAFGATSAAYCLAAPGGQGLGGTATTGTGGNGVLGAAGTAGAGASASTTGGPGVAVGSSVLGAAAGPSGGGITSGNVPGAGAVGASSYLGRGAGAAGAAGAVDSTAPTAGLAVAVQGSPGGSSGSGSGSITTAAQAGADAGATCYGAGGAGGGASLNGNASGAGGSGGPGCVLVITYFQ